MSETKTELDPKTNPPATTPPGKAKQAKAKQAKAKGEGTVAVVLTRKCKRPLRVGLPGEKDALEFHPGQKVEVPKTETCQRLLRHYLESGLLKVG